MAFGTLSAATIKVSSLAALQKAVDKAKAGDNIVLADGTYATTAPIIITRQGTAAKPITVAAATVGGVTITGKSGFSVDSPARYVTVKGFVFKHAADSTTRIQYGASHCRFTRNVFELTGVGSYLIVAGDHAEIDFNTFQNKSTEGRMILVEGPGGEPMAQHTWIHHNYFTNFQNSGRNNSSAIQFGRSWSSLTPAYGIVEYNLFVDCRGENENISHKASNCVYRYNTFGPGSTELSLRHGNHTKVYGNFFFNTEGIRIFGDDHRIYSNYFEGNSRAIHLGNGGAEVADGADLKSHDRPDRCEIVYNTLVNNKQNFFMAGRKDGLGATHTTIANNIIQGGGQAAEFNGPAANTTWKGNIIWNTAGTGAIPAGGYKAANPQLFKNASSAIFHLQAGSPAIDAGEGTFPYVQLDMDGQKRSNKPDVGADEFSSARMLNMPLTVADVGPAANPR
ncbi:polysaccharide lyase 6 family protein [Botryobacter ruber]|uniref:polysaccharide lyase 6 family protein n=1 Tax=Botryobacter ruber TaxID=2171629 RepID=UPI00196BA15D|nr:polysaccharide lyase 6 family protein [Botryobacter ruber]